MLGAKVKEGRLLEETTTKAELSQWVVNEFLTKSTGREKARLENGSARGRERTVVDGSRVVVTFATRLSV